MFNFYLLSINVIKAGLTALNDRSCYYATLNIRANATILYFFKFKTTQSLMVSEGI